MPEEKIEDQIGDRIGQDILPGCGGPGPGFEITGIERSVLFRLSPELLESPGRFRSSLSEFFGYAEDIVKEEVVGIERDALRSLVEHIKQWRYDPGSGARSYER